MSNPNKAKGTAAERLVEEYLIARGYPDADRLRQKGPSRADVKFSYERITEEGVYPQTVAIQVKNRKDLRISSWLKDTKVQQWEERADAGLLVVKRRGFGHPAQWLAVMELQDWVDLL